jgi:hypothetical protein
MTITGRLVNGACTAVFPPRPYPRVVITVDMVNSVTGPVTGFKGTPNGAFSRVFGNAQGSNQQYTQPFRLPAGQQFFVVWTSAPAVLSDARATITWMEEG